MKATLLLKTVGFLILVPGTVAGLVPLLLVSCFDLPLALGGYRYIGVALMLVGAAIYVRCSIDLARFGQGIPAPVSPTQFLVGNGLYAHVRNPMYVAGALFMFGEAIAWAQAILLAYASAIVVCYHVAVVYLEEPALRQRFGASYERYCARVPRWSPRLAPARTVPEATNGPEP